MNDQSFHDKMAELYLEQSRPKSVRTEDWKNRCLVSAKLDPPTYGKLFDYCKREGYSINTALRIILSRFFKTNHD